MNMESERKKEVINICLDHFIDNGLEASTRSLSKALNLQNAGLYYYFESKDEAVVLCAEEAVYRLENRLIAPAMKEIKNPELMLKQIQSCADEMAPTMRFLVSVCVSETYREKIKPVLNRLSSRYEQYSERFAEELNCELEEIEPYVYMGATAVANYMIFGEDNIIYPQFKIIKKKISKLLLA
ncbi:MAG: TetR/AcrR family transcriptional regulator [Acutalibacteraceae bacterium]|nr:TetR/AcrR family transcriptional regulator [Acutalibacteraceae bacterium]